MSLRSRLAVLSVSAPILAFVLVGSLLNKVAARPNDYEHLRVFQDVVQLILNGYVEEVNVDRVMEGALRGLAEGLDPDSAYLTAAETSAVERGETLPDAGVGISLTRQYYLRVIAVRDGSPAARAGLLTGDFIRAIDGKPTRDLSVFEGRRRLRGEAGTSVSLLVIRGNAADPHEVALVREKPAPPAVTGRVIRAGVGYVRVTAFGPAVPDALAREVQTLAKGGADRVIIDLRGTSDGALDTGLDAARRFVASGTLAILSSREHERQPVEAAAGDGRVTEPITLLTSHGTAGAAELFAAALAGNQRADVVGGRTAGRAGLQKLVPLPEGRGLWLTWARYLTPAGDPLQGQGLTPTEEVESPDVEFGEPAPATDPVLDAALAHVTAAIKKPA
jgi:carboxyl-terminal processing protease